ncbi:hypothetical protein EOW65_06110 [Sinirhodobacter ferrireducens]|uniref:Glutamine amidotransferase domain-containing protein n=1 Tax=Paenirhodobacter ferrireducens TaxID=1215032 RepID=A0A443LMZ5_9RHOB|nr:hypothetical protein [Sinirhodobacter ferrireducens]RWR50526.1 hypothetical protein EOW65_06110 [Sinirhodobacter ferrireducens]
MSGLSVIFAPLLPWAVIAAGAGLAALLLALALWRGLRGWALRALAALALLGALAQPSLQREERTPLSDIVLLLDDRTASQTLSDRAAQTDAAVARLAAEVQALPNTELRRITVPDGAKNAGTQIGVALAEALAAEPRARVAGAIVVTDGQAHDAELAPALPAPLQLVLTGHAKDWDRRLLIETAPAFGIIGEETRIRLKVLDEGAVPKAAGTEADLTIAIDGGEARSYRVEVGQDLELPLTLDHGGQNVVQFTLAPAPGELTARNNAAVVQINGVRDRLRVLLVSGQPHAGERTWRNLLKSDAGVDLVHFTILRPPEKQDGVPVSELSLIAFPTQELFIDKIDEFDLIIFDRYGERGILPPAYFANIRDYVERGGAVLISAGPEFATVESLWQTPLGEIMPARPTGRVLSEAYLPRPTELGLRHPVTAGLEGAPPPEGEPGPKHWGRWLLQIELTDATGEVVMKGAEDKPLLVLSHAGKGRVALLASDHPWLWDRGFEGGGPQLELLRRIAHWEMKEPELEEEALIAEVEPGSLSLTVTRRTMKEAPGPVTVMLPDGSTQDLALTEAGPGRFSARWQAPGPGLYRLKQGDLERVVALGPASPREFEGTIASAGPLGAAVQASGGGVSRLEDGIPAVRTVREGRPSAGRGWIGITPRGAAAVADIRVSPVLPAWAWLALAALLSVAAWLSEGRGRRRG